MAVGWRVLAEILRRHAASAGLQVSFSRNSHPMLVSANGRPGRVIITPSRFWILEPFGEPVGSGYADDDFPRRFLVAADRKAVLAWLEGLIGLGKPARQRTLTPTTVCARVVASVLARTAFDREPLVVRSGVLEDMSGYMSPIRWAGEMCPLLERPSDYSVEDPHNPRLLPAAVKRLGLLWGIVPRFEDYENPTVVLDSFTGDAFRFGPRWERCSLLRSYESQRRLSDPLHWVEQGLGF